VKQQRTRSKRATLPLGTALRVTRPRARRGTTTIRSPPPALCERRGKRKKAKPPPKKARPKVATIFNCPFCGNSKSCSVKMDYDHSMGEINCDQCNAKHESRITRLSEAIDVYAEWIDMCEDVNTNGGTRVTREAREDADEEAEG